MLNTIFLQLVYTEKAKVIEKRFLLGTVLAIILSVNGINITANIKLPKPHKYLPNDYIYKKVSTGEFKVTYIDLISTADQ